MTREQIIAALDALATDDIELEGEWLPMTARARCAEYAGLVRQLLALEN